MIAALVAQAVAALHAGAADAAVAAVASRWDVLAAAYVGGLTREVWTARRNALRMAAAAQAAAAAAVTEHEARLHLAAAGAHKER